MNDDNDVNDNEDFTPVKWTADVYRCSDCGYIDRCEIKEDHARCIECRSRNVHMYVRAPSKQALAVMRVGANVSKDELEERLDEIDPDWRQRFGGDPYRAQEFYR